MYLNQVILKILTVLERNSLRSGNLIRVTDNGITLVNKLGLQEKILFNKTSGKDVININKFDSFITLIKPSLQRLNHLGISYSCPNIPNELETYKKLAKKTGLKLLEEDSGNPKGRWFFIGNTNNWENSLFEIVLTESPKKIQDNWIPHFQIDIDTKLTNEEIVSVCNKTFGSNFINWKLDIPNYGVVLVMGKLGDVDGVNIYLGLGTNLRNTKLHREKLLKPIK